MIEDFYKWSVLCSVFLFMDEGVKEGNKFPVSILAAGWPLSGNVRVIPSYQRGMLSFSGVISLGARMTVL